MNFCLRIRIIGSSLDSFLPSVTGNHNTFLFLALDGKPWVTTFGVKSRGYYGNGRSHLLVLLFEIFCFAFLRQPLFHICNSSFDTCFAATERPNLESYYQSWVEATLEFARGIDDLVGPDHLYNHCLGLEPS